ncbi:hypothetical protein [Oceanobacillus massiliensis]|uniref:hypothetical protein n=1 Tax=Oceanobacillus massiliensis TaxID=1465765 RepID=UPI0030174D1C
MGKRNKSKRFSHQGATSVKKHAEVFTYRSTLAAEVDRKHEDDDHQTLGGF